MVLITLEFETLIFFLCSDGLIESIPNSPIAVVVIIVVFLQASLLYGGNEEFGWRETMQPILEKAVPSPLATLIVGIVWVSWHIPLWFIEGNSHQSMSFFFFAILGIALSYWLSMIYDVTGAVVFCMILHGLTNTLIGVMNVKQGVMYYVSLAVLTLISIAISTWAEKKRKKTRKLSNDIF